MISNNWNQYLKVLGSSRFCEVFRPQCMGLHSSTFLLAGHSKWQNIRHDKAKNDAKKSKEAYNIANRIQSSVRVGGVEGNAQLATLIEKAKKLNIAKRIVENAIKRGTGEISPEGAIYDVSYEFMGPGGVACIVEASTDNKNRTIGLVKHALSKFNASLSPCQYLFERKGYVIYQPKSEDETLEDALELAIELLAEDVELYDDPDNEYNGQKLFKVITSPSELQNVSNQLSQRGYKLIDSATGYFANDDTTVPFPEGHEKPFSKAVDLLEDIPEVTNYYWNIKDA